MAGDHSEPMVDRPIKQTGSPFRNKKAGTRGTRKHLVTKDGITLKRLTGGGMDRHQSRFAPFSVTDGKHAADKIDIFAIQTERFTRAKAGNRHQANERR